MRYTEIEKFLKKNNLLESCEPKSGIYAITIDNRIVYVGQSKNIYQRCGQHIYNIQNAMFNQEQKYLLLLSAQLGGHSIDCISLEYVELDQLTDKEDEYIKLYKPCLNILTPDGKQDIYKLKIEDVLNNINSKGDC